MSPAHSISRSITTILLDSTFGIQSDRGWSAGADVSWRPHDRVALSLGYDHQQLQTRDTGRRQPQFLGKLRLITGDAGPTLTTSDSYDTFIARADIKLIPNKLKLTTRASYSFANSNFHNSVMPNLNEYYADIRYVSHLPVQRALGLQSGIYIPDLRHERRVRKRFTCRESLRRAWRAPISSSIPWTGSTGTPRRIWCRHFYSTSFSLSLRVRWQEWCNRVLIVLILLLSCTGDKLGMAVVPPFVIAVAK